MKKAIAAAICACLLLAMAGCGESGSAQGRTGGKTSGVNDVLEQQMAGADVEAEAAEKSGGKLMESTEQIDVDLTKMSSTMVFAEVSNIMVNYESYIGKTIKMGGLYTTMQDENSGKRYFACIIQDATACCANGIEFVLTEDYSFPDDYPEKGDEISVVGVFDIYKEGESTYCTLRDAKLVKNDKS
ncbi:MAG: hypothetical protein IJ773_05605 [Lachnospiraceae bacterium]|nr:hypothetical protein [Lachnospiraceae bacterium]